MDFTGITIRRLCCVIKRRILWLTAGLLSGILCAALAFHIIPPKFSSRSIVYLSATQETGFMNNSIQNYISASEEGGIVDMDRLTAGKSLASTCAVILKSDKALQDVINQAELNWTIAEMSKAVTFKAENGSEVLSITVVTNDPLLSAELCNLFAGYVGVIMEEVIKGGSAIPFGEAAPALEPSSASLVMLVALGGGAGVSLAAALVILISVCNTKVKNEEDITRYVETRVLAIIPVLPKENRSV